MRSRLAFVHMPSLNHVFTEFATFPNSLLDPSTTVHFWARTDGSTSVSGADVLDGSAAGLSLRHVRGAGIISLAAATNATVSLSHYG